MIKQLAGLITLLLVAAVGIVGIKSVLTLPAGPAREIALSPAPNRSSAGNELFINASLPYWDRDRAFETIKQNADVIDEITLFWYGLAEQGEVRKYEDAGDEAEIITWAHENNIRVLALFAYLPQDEEAESQNSRVDQAIDSPEKRKKHIAEIMKVVDQYGYDGVKIDYERTRPDQREEQTAFIKELTDELHRQDKISAMTVYGRSTLDDSTYGQDLAKLSTILDEMVMMGFNQHYAESEPGPVAASWWVSRNIDNLIKLGVVKKSFMVSVPLFAYDWPKDNSDGRGHNYDEIMNIAGAHGAKINWSKEHDSPYFEYEDRIAWFENADSIRKKIRVAKSYNLPGISLWRLGGEDPALWNTLRELK